MKSGGVGSNSSTEKSVNEYIGALADSSPVGLWVTDKTGGLIYANKTLTDWAGRPLKELLGKGWHTSLGPAYKHKKENELDSVLPKREDYHVELQFESAGVTRWLDVTGRPYYDQEGEFAGYSGAAIDITETRRSMEESMAGASRQAAFFSAAFNAVIIMDAKGVIIEFNPSAERIFGYKKDEVIGRELADIIIPPRYRDAHRQGLARYLNTGKGKFIERMVEISAVRKGGGEFPVELYITRIGDVEPLTFMGIVSDLTLRKRADEAARANEKRWLAMIENSNDGIALLNLKAELLFVSSSVAQILGYTPDEMMAIKDMAFFTHPDDKKFVSERFSGLVRPGASASAAYRVRTKDGSYRWVRVVARNALNEPDINGIIVNFRDITEGHKAREQLMASERRYHFVVQNASDIITVFDRQGIITYQSATIKRLLGLKQVHVGGNIFESPLVHPDDVVRKERFLRQLLKSKPETEMKDEFRMRHTDGSWRYLEVVGVNLLHIPDVGGVMLSSRDITERKAAELALKESEALLKQAQAAGNIGSFSWDLKTQTISFSPEAEILFGNKPGSQPKNFKYEDMFRHVNPEDHAVLQDVRRRSSLKKVDINVEYRIRRADNNEERWLNARADTLLDQQGRPDKLTGVLIDVTERKRSQERESLLAAVVDSSDDAIVSKDLNGIITSWNLGAERLFGYKSKEVIGKSILIIFPPERYEEEARILNNIRSGKKIEHFETVRLRKGGNKIDVSLTISPIKDDLGRVIGASKIARDITPRKRAEAELLASRLEVDRQALVYDTTLSTIADFAFTFDRLGRLVFANQVALRLWGMKLEQVAGKTFLELPYPRELAAKLQRQIRQVARTGRLVKGETAYTNPRGQTGYYEYVFKPVKRARGRVEFVVGSSHDSTKRKRREELDQFYLKLSDRLRQLTDSSEIQAEVSRMVGEMLKTERTFYVEIDYDRQTATVVVDYIPGKAPSLSGAYPLASFAPLLDSIKSGQPFIEEDTMTSSRIGEDNRRAYTERHIASFITMPILSFGKLVAAFCVTNSQPRTWQVEDVEILREVSGRTWTAIERARTAADLKTSQKNLRRELVTTKKLQEISTNLVHHGRTNELYEKILETAALIMHADFASIHILDPNTGEFEVLARYGFSPKLSVVQQPVAPSKTSPSAAAIKTGKRQIVTDITKSGVVNKATYAFYEEVGIKALQSTPLISRDGTVLGAITTHWARPHTPSNDDFILLDVLARQTADAIERTYKESELEASEMRFRTLIEKSSEAIQLVDREGNLLFSSESVKGVTGFEPREIVGHKAKDHIHPDDWPAFQLKLEQLLKHPSQTQTLQYRVRHKNGGWVWIETIGSNHLKTPGINALVGNFRDVSKSRQAELRLKRNEEWLRALVENSSDGIAVFDEKGHLTYVSPAAASIMGYSVAEMLKMQDFSGTTHPDDQEYIRQAFSKITELGQQAKATYRARTKSGNYHWVEVIVKNAVDNPAVKGYVINYRDVTEQKLSEQAIRDSQVRLSRAQEAGNVGIFEWEFSTDHITYSPQAERIFGLKPGGGQVTTYKQSIALIHPADRVRLQAEAQSAIKEHRDVNLQYRIIRPDKSVRWLQIMAESEYGKTSEPLRMIGVIVDITDRQQAEEQKDEFIAIASHELKTPVTSMKMYVQGLKRQFARSGDTSTVAVISHVDDQLNRLNVLVRDLLDVSRIGAGQLMFNISRFDYSAIVAEIVAAIRMTTDTHSIRCIGVKKQMINSDRDRVGQVLTNLLSNAVKYSPNAKIITVTIRKDNEEIITCVSDRGLGIPKAEQEHLFERFARVSSKRTRDFPGLGLGLYITAQIVDGLGGRIWVKSEVGKGSKFYFSLPVAKRAKKV